MAKTSIEWTIEKRFWNYVKVTNTLECWEWQGGYFANGYGQFRSGKKKVKAHRYCYELFYGSIPESMCVCHHCDNVRCVNPLHLFLGTAGDNNGKVSHDPQEWPADLRIREWPK